MFMPRLNEDIFISPDTSIKEALQQLDRNALQVLLVVDQNRKLLGTITDGDIRRSLLKDMDFSMSLSACMQTDFHCLSQLEKDKAYDMMLELSIPAIPLLNSQKQVVDVVFLKSGNDADKNFSQKKYNSKAAVVFILAGGKGTRMQPVTDILPKALIPLKDIPIVELIMQRFSTYGFKKFVLSLNYREKMIKSYFSEGSHDFDLQYVKEEKYCGTAGSLALVKDHIDQTLLVSNCDTLISINLDDFYLYHKQHKNDVTILGVMKHTRLSYGVLETQDGLFSGIREKPEYDFLINAGLYVLEPCVLEHVKMGEAIDMPDLLLRLKDAGLQLDIFPCSAEILDIGQWDEYNKSKEKIEEFNLIG